MTIFYFGWTFLLNYQLHKFRVAKPIFCLVKEQIVDRFVHCTIWTWNKHHVNSLWCCDLIWQSQDFPILHLIESPNNKCSVYSFLRWHQDAEIPQETGRALIYTNPLLIRPQYRPSIPLLVILSSLRHTPCCISHNNLSHPILYLGHILHFLHLDDHLTILLFISVPYSASSGSPWRREKPLKVYYKNIIDLWEAILDQPQTAF